MGNYSAASDNRRFYIGVRQHCRACCRWGPVLCVLPVGNGPVDVFFQLPVADSEYLCLKQQCDGKGLFPASCYAGFNRIIGPDHAGCTVCVFSDFRDLVSRPWAACAQRARPYDAAADFAACHALAWLRHYHLGADYKVQGSCHAGRLRPAALDVRNARRI